ncbi:serine/threonine-protein kinase [Streptomyces genisteinicus]|uniref:non-specific serine/threonine protein kinase n=1 Tax=Streptomyces genisteinicus TaxID=2768068 RepID=A0A7H0HV10_9ACTN|nr:serine/threonine-protein kinase [Streptomyces genisteinicus]QNP64376.1 protein kinase [Streptomyces genisteinicus]
MSEGEPGRRVIDGRFELQARLGGGGMGTVWRARDVVLDRAVALKEVRPPDPGLAEYDPPAAALLRARVLREARALARVDHANVVTIHHVVDGGEHTYPWLVMELVTGGSLADRLARGPMEPRETAALGREVFAALRAAHAAGIQHRDVKPANVLLRPDGRPVLTDFGIAAIRESTALTATGSVIGTPDYMAPERIAGGDGGPEADLWSLAMMLYVAVEGDHPLRRGSTLATLAAVLNEELPPPRRAGVLAPALAAMLAKDPAARPAPDAVDAMLADAAAGRTAAPPPERDAGTTSFHLAPPARPSVPDAPYVPDPPTGPPAGGHVPGGHVPGGGGTAPPFAGPHSVRDAVPGGQPHDHALRITVAGDGRDAGEARRRRRITRIVVTASLASTVAAGLLVWRFLPDDASGGEAGGKPGPSASASRTPSATGAADRPDASPDTGGGEGADAATADLLTPEGIRTAVAALKKETGTDRLCSLNVYQEHVSAEVMLDGSNSRYDTWTYRPGKGVEKGIISGSVTDLESAFDVDDFDWDAVPGLFARADKELNVPDVTMRYLLVEGADPTFGDPKGMSAYLSNDHSQSGYIAADHRGKVLRVMPNDED